MCIAIMLMWGFGDLRADTLWIGYGLFMSGVCAILVITQRAQVAYFNQKMVWLGAPEPPLPVRGDSVARVAGSLRFVFNTMTMFAVATHFLSRL